MGVTMWVQMRLNPTPPDPTQAMIFTWMPIIFTFMLASFPAGLVIYWAWNNTLSMTQQYIIMKRQGVEVDLFGNIREASRRSRRRPSRRRRRRRRVRWRQPMTTMKPMPRRSAPAPSRSGSGRKRPAKPKARSADARPEAGGRRRA